MKSNVKVLGFSQTIQTGIFTNKIFLATDDGLYEVNLKHIKKVKVKNPDGVQTVKLKGKKLEVKEWKNGKWENVKEPTISGRAKGKRKGL